MNNKNNIDIEEVIEKLTEYINFDGSENGEYGQKLIRIWESHLDYMTTKFQTALEKELIEVLNCYLENCEIIEREIVKKEVKKIKEVVWK